MTHKTIAIIGCGNMGSCLIKGLLADGYPAHHFWVADPDQHKLKAIHANHSVQITTDNHKAVLASDVVLLAVKPQALLPILRELADTLKARTSLVISVAAGITTQYLQNLLGDKQPIIRTMPNTPALIGCGATALFANANVKDTQQQFANYLFKAVGKTVWVTQESDMDIVTALSGSGPAYFFLFMEALQNAAISLGLPEDIAHTLTLQTALGSARMAMEDSTSLSELRQRVTSPGGTTEAALNVFMHESFPAQIQKALLAAKHRSEELAKTSG